MQFYKHMKNKLVLISLIIIGLLIGGFVLSKNSKTVTKADEITAPAEANVLQSSAPMSIIPADKIEVVHFHATQQCWSCITVGEYALKTIKEKFPDEFASGKIVYKDINGELKENQEIVVKYQAGGSSLFVNAIRGEKDDIAEDTTVWRLVTNETQFMKYFENKLKALLGE